MVYAFERKAWGISSIFTNIRGQSYMLFGGLDWKIISLLLMGSAASYSAFLMSVALLCLFPSSLKKYLTVLFRSALGKVNLGAAPGNP